MFEFIHILPKIGLQQPSIFLSVLFIFVLILAFIYEMCGEQIAAWISLFLQCNIQFNTTIYARMFYKCFPLIWEHKML